MGERLVIDAQLKLITVLNDTQSISPDVPREQKGALISIVIRKVSQPNYSTSFHSMIPFFSEIY